MPAHTDANALFEVARLNEVRVKAVAHLRKRLCVAWLSRCKWRRLCERRGLRRCRPCRPCRRCDPLRLWRGLLWLRRSRKRRYQLGVECGTLVIRDDPIGMNDSRRLSLIHISEPTRLGMIS